MIIAVDFDGTIVEHEFPEIGNPVPGAIKWLRAFHAAGAKLILLTMRSDWTREGNGKVLSQAVEYLHDNRVRLWGVNRNCEQGEWTGSPKVYAHIYIDDAAFGCPLLPPSHEGGKPMANWDIIGPAVMEKLLNLAGVPVS